jgi:hypothetical protein
MVAVAGQRLPGWRMRVPVRQMLPAVGCHHVVELPVLAERAWRGAPTSA